ncbi:XRE family transcriptional regulator [Nocardia sp. NPDC052112]|uniref:XRE family transcriptional regulator n=1 Tax=Nocardia sp. NPDC052112 TaxID=3155646 RepID=UPI003427BC32
MAGFKRLIPPGFFDSPSMRKALAHHDFGSVFDAVRTETGLSQGQLAHLVGLSQGRVSEIENKGHKVTGLGLGARISMALGIPASTMGFWSEPGSLVGEEVSWVYRRDFLSLTMATAMGSNLHPELDRLGSQLPTRVKSSPRTQIGVNDIEAIEEVADFFRRQGLARGSGLYRDAALAQLHEVRSYENVECSAVLRPWLWVATAELAWVTGWLAYDVEDHDGARRVWSYALWAAGQGAEHPRSTDLSVAILLDLAHQALHLWRPLWTAPTPAERDHQQQMLDDALRCAQAAAATAISRRHPVSTVTEAYTASVTAWCWAARGDATAVHRLIQQSQDLYATVDHSSLAPWAAFITPAEISAQHGHSYYLLSTQDRDHAPRAVQLLRAAVDGHALEHARSKAVALPTLAGACLQAGDHDSAAFYCDTAIEQIAGLTSRRCYTRLSDLNRIAAQYDRDSLVTDMRAQISDTLEAK